MIDDDINRAMPFNAPQSLAPDEVYSVIAWLLLQNQVIADDVVIDALPKVQMPKRNGLKEDFISAGIWLYERESDDGEQPSGSKAIRLASAQYALCRYGASRRSRLVTARTRPIQVSRWTRLNRNRWVREHA